MVFIIMCTCRTTMYIHVLGFNAAFEKYNWHVTAFHDPSLSTNNYVTSEEIEMMWYCWDIGCLLFTK